MKKNLFNDESYYSLLQRIKLLHPNSTRLFGKMSVSEMICHLSDQLRLALGQKPIITKPNLYNKTLMKWATLYLVQKMPRNLNTIKEQEQGINKAGTKPGTFEKDLNELFTLLKKVIENKNSLGIHPLFGKLKVKDWGRLIYMHIDYHLCQFSIS